MAIAITVKGAVPQRRPLYIALSALMALIAAVGFWPTYYGPLVRLTLAQPPLIHVHAVVFTGWLALFTVSQPQCGGERYARDETDSRGEPQQVSLDAVNVLLSQVLEPVVEVADNAVEANQKHLKFR